MVSSVRFVLNSTESDPETFTLRGDVISTIESKLQETKKPKKGEEVKPLDPATLDITFDLCSSLTSEIQRKAIQRFVTS